jgi:hypothetical protein
MTFARSFRLALGVLAVVSAGAAAAAQDVGYNAMPGTNFTAFKTYKWVQIEGAAKPDQIVDQQITQALDAALASKGLTKTTDAKADLLVGYEVAVQQQKEWNAYGTGVYGGFRYGGGMTTATESTINIGTLGVSMYDQAAKQLVWRGSASKTIDPKAKPEKRQANINKAVVKMLKNYPPPVKK